MAYLKINSYIQRNLLKGEAIKGGRGNRQKGRGGTISEYGSYVIHTFTETGTFTCWETINCDIMVVGGGGSGEWEGSGTTVRLADSGDKVVIGANNPPAEADAYFILNLGLPQ